MRVCSVHKDAESRSKTFRKVRLLSHKHLIDIGVIFHVVYKDYDPEIVLMSIDIALGMLNADFNKAPDTTFKFHLVEIKYGQIETQSSSNMSVLDQAIKEPNPAIMPERNLNIWLTEFSDGLLGYSQFPWEADNNPKTDGVVIDHKHLITTLTHEVRHWLGLKGYCLYSQGSGGIGNVLNSTYSLENSEAGNELKKHPHKYGTYDDVSLHHFQMKEIVEMVQYYRPGMLRVVPSTYGSSYDNEGNLVACPGYSSNATKRA